VASGEKLRNWVYHHVKDLYAKHKLSAIINPTIGFDVPILSEEAKIIGESDTVLLY
jgi:hypothetical protein